MKVASNVGTADIAAHHGTKACKGCEFVRPRRSFGKDPNGVMGLTIRCKACTSDLYYARKGGGTGA